MEKPDPIDAEFDDVIFDTAIDILEEAAKAGSDAAMEFLSSALERMQEFLRESDRRRSSNS